MRSITAIEKYKKNEERIKLLRKKVEEAGSIRAYAEKIGVKTGTVSNMLYGYCNVSDRVIGLLPSSM